ncbi:hypothetical protein JCM11251_001481 [Rhodosporidiobolus azoricus]
MASSPFLRCLCVIWLLVVMFCASANAQDEANESTSTTPTSSSALTTASAATAAMSGTTVYTTYTVNSSIVTWYATTPSTTLATISTGSVEAATDYFSNMYVASASSLATSGSSQATEIGRGWLPVYGAGVIGAVLLGGWRVL